MRLEQEIELAKMMVEDIDKVYKKYAKAALQAQQERYDRVTNEKIHGCVTALELQNLYGYDGITRQEYEEGLNLLEDREKRIKQLSLIELHRKNLKEIRDKWKGTINELQEELDELRGLQKDNRTYVEKLEAEERAKRYASMI